MTISIDYDGALDPEGWDALYIGGGYYDAGMSHADATELEERIACFQNAEFYYLQAASKGNPYAWKNLGYIYSYDRCEGHYLAGAEGRTLWEDVHSEPYPREERAFECYQKAAEAGVAEAMYKLGDMYKHGIGCDLDPQKAFSCYEQAFEMGKEDEPVTWGSIALRLGGAYENGFGCTQSFAKALQWYKQAVTGLEIAVRAGDHYYTRALAGAQDAVKRCMQEKLDA